MNKNDQDPLIKQQIKEAKDKALKSALFITLIFIAFNFFNLGSYFWASIIFIFSRGFALIWFGRKVLQHLESCEPIDENASIRTMNAANGNPASSHFIPPQRL